MPSVREFPLPDLGEGLTSAEIVRWLVEVGDVIQVDQPVAEVETAKAVVEVPCPYAGVVTSRFGEAGAEVPVGAPLVTVAVAAAPDEPTDAPAEGSGNVLVGYGTTESSGTRRRRVTTAVSTAAPVPAPVPAVISPLVRRLARENGIDLATVTGSGPDGLIMRADVTLPQAAPAAAPAPTGAPTAAPTEEVVPLRGVARIAAETFSRSRREIPDATCWVDADATELLAARRTLDLGLLALLGRICTAALARYPELNSSVVTGPDGAATGVRRHSAVHLGFAAQTPRGLAVPVVRDAHLLSTGQLAAELARLTASAREGRLGPAELTGGTFTLNNYGVFGVDGSTPIINHPEAAMLGVGRIAAKPWVHQGELAVRQVVQLSFSFDHRVCDGAVAGAFLRFVADAVESPVTLLRNL
ncbi:MULTISPECIES: dihydrolipoamide acetyltransferase family protein [Streptacidiphilus]|uniref:Dihydrolipoamide acetyltransferase component of pyruvate dehydrogenase complex n=1 Tax=Streptacidiphilus cavernicola TaxID=3342716 RepID=A0ABV6UPF3_9ACTN|nr:dihydrolipoamide acetyltransferase family protein [Streptacidiphilus jeojiense]